MKLLLTTLLVFVFLVGCEDNTDYPEKTVVIYTNTMFGLQPDTIKGKWGDLYLSDKGNLYTSGWKTIAHNIAYFKIINK